MDMAPSSVTELLKLGARIVLDVLIDGLRIEDPRLNELCLRALQSFGRNAVGDLESLILEPDITPRQRDGLQTAIDWIHNRPPPDHHSGVDVIPVMVDAFRISDEQFNSRALHAARLMHPVFVDKLVADAGRPGIEPDHCLRLLEAIEENNGTLNSQGAEVLMQLRIRPGFEIIRPKAGLLLAYQWALRPDRTLSGH